MGAPPAAWPSPPELPEPARARLVRLPERAPELAELLRGRDEYYRTVFQNQHDELVRVCEVNLRNAVAALLGDGDPVLRAARKTAYTQARQGIPLSAVLRAFRISGTFSYESILEQADPASISAEQMLAISTGVWRIVDAYSEEIAAAYAEFEATAADRDERARRACLDGLLDGSYATAAEREHAARVLDLPASGWMVVVHVDGRAGTSPVLDPVRWRSVWRGTGDAEDGVVVVDKDTGLHRLRRTLDAVAARVGLSPLVSTTDALGEAHRRAVIAKRCLPRGATGVVQYGEQPVTTLVAGAQELARDLARDVLYGILLLPEAERDVLLRTLHAWFAEGGSARGTAARLYVHPNTVRYRMRRVHELTRLDLTDPRCVAELFMAIEAARLDPAVSEPERTSTAPGRAARSAPRPPR